MNQKNALVTATVELDYPIKRGDKEIKTIELRKPRAGEMRGLSLTDVLQMEYNALNRLLPRITQPTLTEPEIMNLDPADLLQIGTEVTSFLLSKKMRGEMDEGAQPSS
ncbi:MAG: phage tail assembly protein [Pseudomonadota bacterium]|nr:phage tail assembly protein [Pseudomonadota bacterium]|tara:strand:- start:2221 stop:2544 length:324 start_codon:yes stop_codon:yes gene_type:complete